MSSVPPEQVNSQYKDMSSMFNQQNPAASASSSKPAGDDSKPPLPKGVVLDKDGKPYVYTNDSKPAQPVYSGSTE
jgi:FAD-linked sulfhydryl oxidase